MFTLLAKSAVLVLGVSNACTAAIPTPPAVRTQRSDFSIRLLLHITRESFRIIYSGRTEVIQEVINNSCLACPVVGSPSAVKLR